MKRWLIESVAVLIFAACFFSIAVADEPDLPVLDMGERADCSKVDRITANGAEKRKAEAAKKCLQEKMEQIEEQMREAREGNAPDSASDKIAEEIARLERELEALRSAPPDSKEFERLHTIYRATNNLLTSGGGVKDLSKEGRRKLLSDRAQLGNDVLRARAELDLKISLWRGQQSEIQEQINELMKKKSELEQPLSEKKEKLEEQLKMADEYKKDLNGRFDARCARQRLVIGQNELLDDALKKADLFPSLTEIDGWSWFRSQEAKKFHAAEAGSEEKAAALMDLYEKFFKKKHGIIDEWSNWGSDHEWKRYKDEVFKSSNRQMAFDQAKEAVEKGDVKRLIRLSEGFQNYVRLSAYDERWIAWLGALKTSLEYGTALAASVPVIVGTGGVLLMSELIEIGKEVVDLTKDGVGFIEDLKKLDNANKYLETVTGKDNRHVRRQIARHRIMAPLILLGHREALNKVVAVYDKNISLMEETLKERESQLDELLIPTQHENFPTERYNCR